MQIHSCQRETQIALQSLYEEIWVVEFFYPSKLGTQLPWSCWGCRRQPILAGCANPETWRCCLTNWFKVASILKQSLIVLNDSSMQCTYALFHIVSVSKNICVSQKTLWNYERRHPLIDSAGMDQPSQQHWRPDLISRQHFTEASYPLWLGLTMHVQFLPDISYPKQSLFWWN